MAVGVEGQADLRVAEQLHDDARVDALDQSQARARVPEIVKPLVGEPGGGQEPLKPLRDGRKPGLVVASFSPAARPTAGPL